MKFKNASKPLQTLAKSGAALFDPAVNFNYRVKKNAPKTAARTLDLGGLGDGVAAANVSNRIEIAVERARIPLFKHFGRAATLSPGIFALASDRPVIGRFWRLAKIRRAAIRR